VAVSHTVCVSVSYGYYANGSLLANLGIPFGLSVPGVEVDDSILQAYMFVHTPIEQYRIATTIKQPTATSIEIAAYRPAILLCKALGNTRTSSSHVKGSIGTDRSRM
jgi:hypothetical protein